MKSRILFTRFFVRWHLTEQLTYDSIEDLAVLPFVKIGRGYGVDRGSFQIIIFRYDEAVAGTRPEFRTVIILVHHDHFQSCDVQKFAGPRQDGN